MGKRNQQRMTGLYQEERIKRSIERKDEEERRRKEEQARMLRMLIDSLTKKGETK